MPKHITVSTIVCCPNVAIPYTTISTKMTIFVFRFFSVIRDKSLLRATIFWLCLLCFMALFGGAPHLGQENARSEISASHSWQRIRLTIHPTRIAIYRLCFRGGPFRNPSFGWVPMLHPLFQRAPLVISSRTILTISSRINRTTASGTKMNIAMKYT